MADIAPPIPTTAFIETVLSRLESLPHWQRRLFIKQRMAAQYPRFFYKYFGSDPNDAKSIRNLRDVIVESRFWLADHRRFNDPFDLKAKVVFLGTEDDRRKRFKALIANQSPPGSLKRERREALAQMMNRSHADWTSAIEEIFRARTNDIGVCSFATNSKPYPGRRDAENGGIQPPLRSGPHSILMWAHYGRSHEGVCLQFETALCPRVFTYAQEVQYSEEYPIVNFVKNFERNLLVPLVRKHKGWEYEKEWRMLHMTGVKTYLPFDPKGLRRLIFGCRASAETYSTVMSLLEERCANGHPPVKLFRAVQHSTEYNLDIWSLREKN